MVELITQTLRVAKLGSVAKAWKKKLAERSGDVVEASVALWTTQVHQQLNEVLLKDHESELASWMGIVRLITHHLTSSSNAITADVTVWRGTRLTRDQVATLRVGEVIRPPMFLATSLDQQEAQRAFQKPGSPLVKLHVPAGCRNACNIASLSACKKQKEVLLPPYTPLHVLRVSSQLIEVIVLNGLRYMHDVELPTKAYARSCLL